MLKNKTLLFIHQNFPGQFLHLCKELRRDNKVYFIAKPNRNRIEGVEVHTYQPSRQPRHDVHAYLRPVEDNVLHGQAVARLLLQLQKQDIKPDLIVGHTGWGETLFIKDIFPHVPMLSYFEFFYHTFGADVNFDPEYRPDPEIAFKLRLRNAVTLSCLEATDQGLSPTWWQRSQVPVPFQAKISVIHEGVDTVAVAPDASATLTLASGVTLAAGMPVVTYVARNLEPYRGFHIFMRSLEKICAENPAAHIVIVGGDGVSYGSKPSDGQSFRAIELARSNLDPDRVHFLGNVGYDVFRTVLQISAAHVYLTYPFVLSWSMLEAMSAQCLVIGSSTSPVEEVITHGVNGILVKFFDADAVATTVSEVLQHPERFLEIRRASRQTIVDQYDLHKVCLPRQKTLLSSMI